MSDMNAVLRIGLPELTAEDIASLAELCEEHITGYIFEKLGSKSIEEMTITCILEMDDDGLQLDVQIDIEQKFETGHDLDALLDEATQNGVKWLEKQLMEMKDE